MRDSGRVWGAALLALTGTVLATAAPPPVQVATLQKVALNIDSQPVGDALNELGRQTGLVIIVYSAVGRGVMAPRILGKFTANRALDEILAHTGLHYEYLDSKTVAVLPVSRPRPVPKPIQSAVPDSAAHAAHTESDTRKSTQAAADLSSGHE